MNTIEAGEMLLEVEKVSALTPEIILIRLRAPDGAALPGYQAGAHIKVQVQVEGQHAWRHYSLIDFDHAACAAPLEYVIAVRRESSATGGRGGSLYLHTAIQVGQRLRVGAPRNAFGLKETDDDVVLIAGGIGVTPLASMAAVLQGTGKRYALHYSGRSVAGLALVSELQALAGSALTLYGDDAERRLDLALLLGACRPSQPLYVCGPKGMITAVRENAQKLGWAPDMVRYELFAEAVAEAGDAPFEVELLQSGCTVQVGAHETILDAMIAAGLDPMYDCRRGDCGVCTVGLVDGEADHRDSCQTRAERAAGNVIQICISRARSGRLVLDA
ncbi:PDR/VanB family oxidoreductase [Massilia niabensis]|uniref:PDR/VanB family oxidoreductase n=1 Tax=Massilia niabensis TaxID=544910 RepID=A0ABW0L3G7_9BURK